VTTQAADRSGHLPVNAEVSVQGDPPTQGLMLAPGDLEFAGNAVAHERRAARHLPRGDRYGISRLRRSDGVADARHSPRSIALMPCNEQAEPLIEEVNRLTATLTAKTGPSAWGRLAHGVASVAAGMRRNALLVIHGLGRRRGPDSAVVLLGLGKVGATAPFNGYSANPGPAYVDREPR